MALYNLDIQKFYQNEYWTNRYIINIGALADAASVAASIVGAERAITSSVVTFLNWRAADQNPATDAYWTVPINQAGLASPGDLLPLFNVVRVDFAAGFGRPSRKYLRACIGETYSTNGTLSQAFIDLVTNSYVTPLVNLLEYVDKQAETISSGAVWPHVGMRQLRRGTKRKNNPVIPL